MNHEYIRAIRIRAKVARLSNLKRKSFAFRLAAITAADNRPGKVWS